jgi:hypothetical protein
MSPIDSFHVDGRLREARPPSPRSLRICAQESAVPYKVVEFQDTPNPNAVKCILDPPVPEGPAIRSYQSAQSAAADPLAASLLTLPGVAGVFILQGWVTVSKTPDAPWKAVKSAVRKALADAP